MSYLFFFNSRYLWVWGSSLLIIKKNIYFLLNMALVKDHFFALWILLKIVANKCITKLQALENSNLLINLTKLKFVNKPHK